MGYYKRPKTRIKEKPSKQKRRRAGSSPDRNRTCIKSLGNFYSIH